MAHSQRQKKRSSQFKKKHFDAKARAQSDGGGGGGKKKEHPESAGAQKKSSQLQAGGGGEVKSTEGAISGQQVEKGGDYHVQGDIKSQDVKKYSRRKLGSNWERYDHDDEEVTAFSPETEEQLQQRLVQLLDLPLPPQTTLWRGEGEREGREEEEGTLLSLNVTQLADSLKELPVHVRLDLSTELLERYGVEEGDLEEAGVEERSPPPDLQPADQDLKSLLSTAKDLTTPSFDFRPPDSVRHEQSSASEALQVDADLDSLLVSSSQQKPHPLPAPSGIENSPNTSNPLSHSHMLSDQTSHSSSTALPPPVAAESSLPTTAELDDMLDDLLS